MRYFATSAAAMEAGYRPCLRCRPERESDEFSRVFRQPPRAARRKPRTAGSSRISLRMPTREPFNADWVFSFLGRRALPDLENVHGHTYRRRVGGHCISVSRQDGALWLEVPDALADGTANVLARVRRVFDLDADPDAIDSHLLESPRCARWVRAAPGIRVPGTWDAFEGAVRAVLGQQVSIDRATDLAARLVDRFGTGGFPAPEALASADVATIGIPGARAAAVRYLARAVLERGDAFLLDPPAAREILLRINGIGPWTAEYVAMRVARDPDAFPASDWAVRKVLGANARDALRRAAPWRPWRAYAVMHLWRGYSGECEGAPLAKKRPGPKAPATGH